MKEKISRLTQVPAWALSVLISIATIIYVIRKDNQGMRRELAGQDHQYIGPFRLGEVTDLIVFLIIIPIAIFFICRKHPKSVWYTPVLSNAFGLGMGCMVILSFVFDWDPVTLSDWLLWGGTFAFTIIGAIIGAKIGRRRINLVK